MSSTICALATPPGAGGIAVVRVSGPEAYAVVGEIFTPVSYTHLRAHET